MNASSESGECASLISRASFSGCEATCLPGMLVTKSFAQAVFRDAYPLVQLAGHTAGRGRATLGRAWRLAGLSLAGKRLTYPRQPNKPRAGRRIVWAFGMTDSSFLPSGNLADTWPAKPVNAHVVVSLQTRALHCLLPATRTSLTRRISRCAAVPHAAEIRCAMASSKFTLPSRYGCQYSTSNR